MSRQFLGDPPPKKTPNRKNGYLVWASCYLSLLQPQNYLFYHSTISNFIHEEKTSYYIFYFKNLLNQVYSHKLCNLEVQQTFCLNREIFSILQRCHQIYVRIFHFYFCHTILKTFHRNDFKNIFCSMFSYFSSFFQQLVKCLTYPKRENKRAT